MKKLVFLMALIMLSGLTFGQGLQKGNLVGFHVITVTLQPGVTLEKFIEFYNSKVIPGYEKNFQGGKAFLAKSIRGENKDSYGVFMVFKTEKDRDKYFKPDGSSTDLGIAANDKLKPVFEELNKLGTRTSVYNDWLVL
jgi:hypothetical protein